ncbi:MAG: hypothetical protein ACXVEF_02900 [Polyangiales bacterium]
MRKKHHRVDTTPIQRPLAPTSWRATLPLVATLLGCHAESVSPDPVVIAEMEPAKPASNVPVDLAPTPEPTPPEPEPVMKWKPNPRPKPKAWIRPSNQVIDVAGF